MKRLALFAVALAIFGSLAIADDFGKRSGTVTSALRMQLNKNPDQITAQDLASVTSLKLPHIHLDAFEEGDFSGLINLKRLEFFSLFHRAGKKDAGPPAFTHRVFSTLPKLEELVITSDQLGTLPDDVFGSLPSLRVLVLTNVTLPHLPSSILALPKLEEMVYDGKGMPKEEYELLKKTLGNKLKAKR
jgi:hypothetical protein